MTGKTTAHARYRVTGPDATRLAGLAGQWLAVNTGGVLGGNMSGGFYAEFSSKSDMDTLLSIMQLGDVTESNSASSGGLQVQVDNSAVTSGSAGIRVFTSQDVFARAQAFAEMLAAQGKQCSINGSIVTVGGSESETKAQVKAFTAEPFRTYSGTSVANVNVYFLPRPSVMIEESALVLDVSLPNATGWDVVEHSMIYYGHTGYTWVSYKGETVMSTTTSQVKDTLDGLAAIGGKFHVVSGRFNPEDSSMALGRILIRLRK